MEQAVLLRKLFARTIFFEERSLKRYAEKLRILRNTVVKVLLGRIVFVIPYRRNTSSQENTLANELINPNFRIKESVVTVEILFVLALAVALLTKGVLMVGDARSMREFFLGLTCIALAMLVVPGLIHLGLV